MRLLIHCGAAMIPAVTLACASASVQPAVRDPLTLSGVRRVYVLVDHRAAQRGCVDYGEMLRRALSEALAEQKVENESTVMETTPVDAHLAEIRAYGADLVLVVSATGGVPSRRKVFRTCGDLLQGYDPLSYEVTVFDSALNRRIWHAETSNSGGLADWVMEKRFRKMAAAIVKRLRHDGVF